jgi:hypothetical protein
VEDSQRWRRTVLAPVLERIRARLTVRAEPDSAVAARLALLLAMRVAEVRWPPDGGEEVFVRNDLDLRVARTYFPQLAELLSGAK